MKPISFKSLFFTFLQWLGALVAFAVSLTIANMISPLSAEITSHAPAMGILSLPLAMLANGAANALILVWAAKRSTSQGIPLFLQLFVLSFFAQVFQTQIETGYFISAFPLLHNNFVLYQLILRGLITSVLFVLLVCLITGGFKKKTQQPSSFKVEAAHFLQSCAWLPLVYIVLYFVFGYYVAWQNPVLRTFYGGPAELNSFFAQWGSTLMTRPEIPVFQFFRGIIWILCLVPVFKNFKSSRIELVVFSALALALLPTVQLTFANPLMPASVSLSHFWEVAISTGIFGGLCAIFVPKKISD